VADDPYFLASVLAEYQRQHGLDDTALAALLACNVAELTPLRLCRRPGAADPSWTRWRPPRVRASAGWRPG
jgi:hypothetical protein